MWPLIFLGLSVLGILILVALKNWELRRGEIRGSDIRRRLDERYEAVAAWMQAQPGKIHRYFGGWAAHGLFHTSALLLRGVRYAERKLIKVTDLVKGKGSDNHRKGASSLFLQNISEYKKGDGAN